MDPNNPWTKCLDIYDQEDDPNYVTPITVDREQMSTAHVLQMLRLMKEQVGVSKLFQEHAINSRDLSTIPGINELPSIERLKDVLSFPRPVEFQFIGPPGTFKTTIIQRLCSELNLKFEPEVTKYMRTIMANLGIAQKILEVFSNLDIVNLAKAIEIYKTEGTISAVPRYYDRFYTPGFQFLPASSDPDFLKELVDRALNGADPAVIGEAMKQVHHSTLIRDRYFQKPKSRASYIVERGHLDVAMSRALLLGGKVTGANSSLLPFFINPTTLGPLIVSIVCLASVTNTLQRKPPSQIVEKAFLEVLLREYIALYFEIRDLSFIDIAGMLSGQSSKNTRCAKLLENLNYITVCINTDEGFDTAYSIVKELVNKCLTVRSQQL